MNNIIISSKESHFALYENIIDVCKAFEVKYESENKSNIKIFLEDYKEPEIVIFNLAGFISDFKIFDAIFKFLSKSYENGEIFIEKFYESFNSLYKIFVQYAHDITYILLKNYFKNNNELKIEYFLDFNLNDLEKDLYVILSNPKSISSIFKKFQKELIKDSNLFFTALKNIKNNSEVFEEVNTIYFEPQENTIVAIDNLGEYLFFDDFLLNDENEDILDLNSLDPYHYIIAMSIIVNPKTVVLYTSFNKDFLKNFFKFIEKNKKFIGALCGKIEFTTQNI